MDKREFDKKNQNNHQNKTQRGLPGREEDVPGPKKVAHERKRALKRTNRRKSVEGPQGVRQEDLSSGVGVAGDGQPVTVRPENLVASEGREKGGKKVRKAKSVGSRQQTMLLRELNEPWTV